MLHFVIANVTKSDSIGAEMTDLQSDRPEPQPGRPGLSVAFDDLPDPTKNYLLAQSTGGKSVDRVISEELSKSASKKGFHPQMPTS